MDTEFCSFTSRINFNLPAEKQKILGVLPDVTALSTVHTNFEKWYYQQYFACMIPVQCCREHISHLECHHHLKCLLSGPTWTNHFGMVKLTMHKEKTKTSNAICPFLLDRSFSVCTMCSETKVSACLFFKCRSRTVTQIITLFFLPKGGPSHTVEHVCCPSGFS